MTDIAQIAARLTDAQKRALLCAQNGVIPSHYQRGKRIIISTSRRLASLGLAEIWPRKLTPLGLAVAQYLRSQDNG